MKKPKKSIHCRNTFRSHELIAYQKSFPFNVVRVLDTLKNELCEKPTVFTHLVLHESVFLCKKHSHGPSTPIVNEYLNINDFISAQKKTFYFVH